MAEPSLHDLIRYVHRLAGQADGALSDAELLTRFAERRDEAAFESLVWRHGQLIWGVCRRMLRNRQDTEDAFQATFLVLARKARSVRKREAVGAWLYQVARRIALELRRKNHAARLVPLIDSNADAPVDCAERVDLRQTLEEEIACLPPKYRLPAVLRYVEGKSTAETAAIVGCPAGTVLSRLAWVRRRLRVRLNRRGFGFAVVLSAATATENAAGVPTVCVLTTVAAALAFVHRKVVGTSRSVLLAQGALQAMLMTKVTVGLFAILGVMSAAAGIGLAVWPGPISNGVSAPPDEQPVALAAQPTAQEGAQTGSDKHSVTNPQENTAPKAPSLPEVTFVRPIVAMLGDHFGFVGRTEAAQTITIRPRISSTLEKIDVKPGAAVKQGDLLFQLDAAIVRAEYDKAVGELRRAQAQVEQTKAALERAKDLAVKGLGSAADVVVANAKIAEATASLSAAQAGVERAKLDVEAAKITAPIAGRLGRIEIDVGNVVGPSTKLATVVSLSPIFVSFNIDERSYRDLQEFLQKGESEKQIQVVMKLSGGSRPERRGILDSIDNSFDPKTGTLRALAKFPNENDEVLPGMFAQVQLTLGGPKERLLVPSSSIYPGQNDKRHVNVVTSDNVIRQRTISVGNTVEENLVVLSGLTAADRVLLKPFVKGIKLGDHVRATEAKVVKPQDR